ncbi:MAG: histidine phosphatase family protein [Gammaproteobacteria bacterium]|jgi:phosphohistidine phosphatase
MKHLALLRHAKSSWDDPGQSDFERPLNKRGRHDAPEMGRRLKKHGYNFDLVLASPAQRVRETLALLAETFPFDGQAITWVDTIYEADPDTLLQVVRECPGEAERVLMVGHNPGFTLLGNRLCGMAIDNVPTCGFLDMTLDIGAWPEASPGCARLVRFDYPKRKAD